MTLRSFFWSLAGSTVAAAVAYLLVVAAVSLPGTMPAGTKKE